MLGELGGIVLAPDMLEEQRGAWCSPKKYTDAASSLHPFDADPFTNPRSHLEARWLCMLERGDDGFGLARRDVKGTIYINPRNCEDARDHDGDGIGGGDGHPLWQCTKCGYIVLTAQHRVWIQPPYDIVLEVIAHLGHTRLVALLRLDTSTEWFDQLFGICEVIMVPRGDRIEFDPPPGVEGDANPFPHGLYYARAEDVPVAISALCYAWPTPRYPWRADPLGLLAVTALR